MLIDYHTHHERCGHATGTLREYVEQGIRLGLDQIGLSDHMPIIHLPKSKILPGVAMEMNELEKYVNEALSLKKEYRRDIDIKVGIEADYIAGYELEIEKLLQPFPFDYIIGSIHFLGEWDFSDSRQMNGWLKKTTEEIFVDYYQAVQMAAESGLYDIIGHFDVIKKYGHVSKLDISGLILDTLRKIKKNDMVIEVNSSGLFKIVKEIYPSPSIIEKASDLDISFTLGSDAHKSEDLHVGVEKSREILEKFGIKELATFENRKRIMVPIHLNT